MFHSILFDSVKTEDVEAVRTLMTGKVGVDELKRFLDRTPLKKEISELPYKPEEYINAKDAYNQTCLHYAISRGNAEITKILIDSGADVNSQNNHGHSALHAAVIKNNSTLVECLLLRGANLNLVDIEGCTPLHIAVTCGDSDNIDYTFSLVLQAEYSLDPPKRTVHDEKVVKLLLKYGADVNLVDRYGQTPLQRMLDYDSDLRGIAITAMEAPPVAETKKFLKFLIQYFDINVVDKKEKCALDINLDLELVKVILEHIAKLKTLNQYVKPDTMEIISERTNYGDYFKKCMEELSAAKGTKLQNSWVTFFNLLMDSKKCLKNYAGNRDLIEDFQRSDCEKKFPIYGAEMKKNMDKGIVKRKLFDQSSVRLSCICPILDPTHLIIKDSLDFLSRKDLSKFCESL